MCLFDLAPLRLPVCKRSSTERDQSMARGHTSLKRVHCHRQVYIHPPPGYSYAPGSVFAGLEVPNRVTVMWAQYSVARPSPSKG